MANFGRKMWAWKHSLKGIANTESEPQMIFPPGVVRASQFSENDNTYDAERWYRGGGYNQDAVDKNLTGFLYAKKVIKTLGFDPDYRTYEYPCIDVTGNASDEAKFLYVRTSTSAYSRSRLSWDLQNRVYDRWRQQYEPDDWYSTLAISSIVSYDSTEQSLTTTEWDEAGFQQAYTGFTPFFPAQGNGIPDGQIILNPPSYTTETSNWVRSSLLNKHYNTFKNVSGTNGLSCIYEIAQIKGSGFNWNEYEGGTPDFDLWGRFQYTSDAPSSYQANGGNRKFYSNYEKIFSTFNGSWPYGVNLSAIRLSNLYAGKTVKFVNAGASRYAGAGNPPLTNLEGATGVVPDDSATIDVSFEVELALQRHGVSTHEYEINIYGSEEYPTVTKKLMSYVSGNFAFLKGDSADEAGNYLLVPVYYKLRTIGVESATILPTHSTNNNVSIRGNRPHVYKYGIVAIRLEKPYNVGSIIHGSGIVLDWESEYPTHRSAYSVVSGRGRGSREYSDYYGGSSVNNPTVDNWEEPFPRTENRNNAQFLGNTDSLNGEVNPVTCLRVSESGKYGFYSGGTVFEDAPVGSGRFVYADQTAYYAFGDFFNNGLGVYAYDSQSSERDVKVFRLSRAFDLSSIILEGSWDWYTDAQNALGYNPGSNANSTREFRNGGNSAFGGSGKLYNIFYKNTGWQNNDNMVLLEWSVGNGNRPDLSATLDASYDMHLSDPAIYGSAPIFTSAANQWRFADHGRKLAWIVGGSQPFGSYLICHTLPGQYDLSQFNTSSAVYQKVNLHEDVSYIRNYDNDGSNNYTGFTIRGWSFNNTGTEVTLLLYRSYNQYRTPVQTRVNEVAVFSLSTAYDVSSTWTHLSSKSFVWPTPWFNEVPSYFNYKPNTSGGLDGTAFYVNWLAYSPKQYIGYDLGTAFNPNDQQPITLEDSKNVITRFGSEYPVFNENNQYDRSYFFHVTDTPDNNADNGYTGRDPFPNSGLSTVINSVNFSANMPYAPGYDATNYPRHDVSGAFIRSFRLSNDGRFLYILWVTDTMISNSSSASIQQWVERYFINHPEGCDGENAWDIGASSQPTQKNGIYFSGTTDIYNIQGDSSGGYLSSATAIDVTPDGLFLQVLQSEAHKAGKTNYKPMIVEHYLGGNDLGIHRDDGSGDYPKGILDSTNPRLPLRSMGSSGPLDETYHWPLVPCKPGLFAETGVNESDANFGNGGSNCAVVFDRTYLAGQVYWAAHRGYMREDTSYEDVDRSVIVAPSSYDIIPSDFSWNTEGNVLYLYGAYLESNNDNRGTVGCQRIEGSPYVMTIPVNLSQQYVNCGQYADLPDYAPTVRSPDGGYYNYLYNNRILGVIYELLATTGRRGFPVSPEIPRTPWSPGTLYRSFFLPVDYQVEHRASTGFGNYDPSDNDEAIMYIKLKYAYDATDGHRIVVDDVDPTDINGFNRGYHNFYVKKSWWNKSVIEAPFNNQNITDDYRKAPHGTILYYFDCSDPSITNFPEVDTLEKNYSFTNFSWYFQGTPGQAGAAVFFYCPADMQTQGGATNVTTGNIDFAIFHPNNYNLTGFSNRMEGGIRFTGNGRDFLEVVANPLFYARHGAHVNETGDDISANQLYDYQTAGSIWNYPTKYYTPPANKLSLGDSYSAENNLKGSLHSPLNMSNRSVSPPSQKNMPSMAQTYPLASVFAHHKGGRYIYFVSEALDQDKTGDPAYPVSDRYRPLRLSVIPIETQIEDSISGDTQHSRGYDTYWGQPPDGTELNVYPYNYRGWGYVLSQAAAVDGPKMNTADWGDWGAIHLSNGRNNRDFYLSMSSRISPDSNTHWKQPYYTHPADNGTFTNKDNHIYDMGSEYFSFAHMSGVYYTGYLGKGFANYDYLGTNSAVEGIATVFGTAAPRHPLHQYRADTGLSYWYGKDLRAGRWGYFYYTVNPEPRDYINPMEEFSWGLNQTQKLEDGASPFYNAGFMQSNWLSSLGEQDALDVPKLIVSNPTTYSVGSYGERPEYVSVMQQMPQQNQPTGQTPPPAGYVPQELGQTYITKQSLYNVRSHTKLGKAYKDGGRKYLTIPYQWSATNSYTIDAEGYWGFESNQNVVYANPTTNALSYNIASIRSFRFASKGRYLFVLLSGRTSEIGGQSNSHAAFSIIKYDLETPYDVDSAISANTQYFTYYENTNALNATYDYWWASVAQPNCYFGSDFYINDDGTKIWVIGLNANSTNYGFAYPTESRTLLREFTLSSGFDLSNVADSGFATYDSQSAASTSSFFEAPVSLEVSPDGNNVYWSRQYINRAPNEISNSLKISSANAYNPFSGVATTTSYADASNLRHFRSTLPQPFNLKQPDQTTTTSVRNKNNQTVTRTTVGVPWYAYEGAAQRVRFSKNYPNRLFRSNLTSQKAEDVSFENPSPNEKVRAIYTNQVLNQAVGGFSSFTLEEGEHKVQKVDGTWNIGNAGMFKPLFGGSQWDGDGGGRQLHAANDMFLFEVNDEENVVLLSDTQLRIYSFVLNNSTKGY